MYAPSDNLLEGIRNAFPLKMFPWDEYFARMAEADVLLGRHNSGAVKSFFVRKAPFGGSYILLGGLTEALRTISELDFTSVAFREGMKDMRYKEKFIEWLVAERGLKVKVWGPPEGSVFFPNEPVLSVTGPLAHVRLVEGIIKEINFSSLSLTKWNRLVRSIRPGKVLEFGRRRSQNDQLSTLYGMVAGCNATSNAEMRRFFLFEVLGTMGHEWVSSFGDVFSAMDGWLTVNPDRPLGLIADTVHCLKSDFPAILKAVYKHREAIKNADAPAWGWRNDSGDFAFLAIEQYVQFMKHQLAEDLWFRNKMRMVLSNELDEWSSSKIIGQVRTQAAQAGLDAEDILKRIIWAAGTKPATCEDQPSLGGVMKLQEIDGKACIKLALDAEGRYGVKTSIPGFNASAFVRDLRGETHCVLMYPTHRYSVNAECKLYDRVKQRVLDTLVVHHPDDPASTMKFEGYRAERRQMLLEDSAVALWTAGRAWRRETISSVQERVLREVDDLPWWMTRLESPGPMKLSLTPDLFEMRQKMIKGKDLQSEYPSW